MIAYMLDTNICIYAIKRKPARVVERLRRTDPGQVGLSSITLSELAYGVAKSASPGRNRTALLEFTTPLDVLPYDDTAADHYGRLRAHLEKRGAPIGGMDLLIAAHALSLSCVLVTNNVREFRRVPGLRVENWV